MKKIIYTLAIVLIAYFSYAQDKLDPKRLFNADTLSNTIKKNANGFVLGWNWGSIGSRLDKAMNVNTYHHPDLSISDSANFKSVIIPKIANGDAAYSTLQAQSIQLEPTIEVSTSTFFKSNPNDTTGAVFGFLGRQSSFLVDSVNYPNENFNRIKFLKSRFTNLGYSSGDTARVLWDPWPHSELYDIRRFDSLNLFSRDSINGLQWYLSINLRSLEDINTINEDEPVLTIKIPYKLYGSSNYDTVRFNQVPKTGIGDTALFRIINDRVNPDTLGWSRHLTNIDANNNTKFIITKRMLRVSSGIDNSHSNITLSCYFKLDSLAPAFNPLLHNQEHNQGNDSARIYNLGLDVYYHGNLDVAIDWIRFETPHAQNLFRGQYDSNILDTLRGVFRTVDSLNALARRDSIWIYRFTGIDEFWIHSWFAHRYYNKLVDGLAIAEVEMFHPNSTDSIIPYHFEHAVGLKEIWANSSVSFALPNCAPYIMKGHSDWPWSSNPVFPSHINYFCGYLGLLNAGNNFIRDTLKSVYETLILKQSWGTGDNNIYPVSLPLNTDSFIYDSMNWRTDGNPFVIHTDNSLQAKIERKLYNYFYKSRLPFLKTPWESNIWFGSGPWHVSTTHDSIYTTGGRPITGEETRLYTWYPLIFGAKGIYTFMGTSDNIAPGIYASYLGVASVNGGQYNGNLNGDTLLYNNVIGSDYITYPDPTGIHLYVDTTINSNINWSDLGNDKNHLYLGRRSGRIEISKINKWVRTVEDSLLNLKLAAWYGKGYYILYRDTLNTNDTLIKKFILLNHDSLRTRPIDRSTYEPWDSSFFDITLLKDTNNSSMDNFFYIGTINRRTDPLILKDTLLFVPSAEFDSLCTKNSDSLIWQSYWWKRLGCRELTIPFNYGNTPTQFDGYILHVSELGANSQWLDSALRPFREPKYYHKIDTVITEDGSVVMKMLPGEGKILKVVVSQLVNGGQDSSGGKPCSGCDVVNDTAQFKIELVPQERLGTDTICCWNLNIINKSSCTFTDFPISFDFDGLSFSSLSFTPSQWVEDSISDPPNNYYYFSGDITPNDTIIVGTICIPQVNTITYEISVGKKFNDTTYHCSRVWSGVLDCPSLANDSTCCDSITVIPESVEVSPLGECCLNIYILCSDTSMCPISRIQIYQYSERITFPPTPPTLLFDSTYSDNSMFSDTTGNIIYQICNDGSWTRTIEIIFYDKTGNIFCEKNIELNCTIHSKGFPIKLPDQINDVRDKEGVNKTIKIEELYCVPNPAENKINVEYRLNRTANVSIEIINSFGNIVSSISIINNKQMTNSIDFDTSLLPSGLYYIKLKAENEYKTIGIIIMH